VAWLGALREKVEDLALAIHDNLPMVAELLCGKKKRVTNLMRRAIVFMSSSPITKEEDFLPATLRTFLKRYGSLPTDLMFLHINVDPFTAYLNGSTARIKVVKFGSGTLMSVRSCVIW
jgi:KUP system potassium uptake protein